MCYLKNLAPEENLDFDLWGHKDEESTLMANEDSNIFTPSTKKSNCLIGNQQQLILLDLLCLLKRNNSLIANMDLALQESSQQFGNVTVKSENKNQESFFSSPFDSPSQFALDKDAGACLGEQLFGRKKYRFKLEPVQMFQPVLYKQRNFRIEVRLVGFNGKQVKNCNILTLCFAICSLNAEWIHYNRVGEPFLKGKTQVELYKGNALFQKLYARDVSRAYPLGKVAIIIYPKESTLKYSTQGPSEEIVQSEQIQPLVLDSIIIKAKRT